MAIQIIVAIRDSAVDAFMRPAFVPAVGAAVRGFGDEVARADSEMGKHPSDYEMYELGSYNDLDASFLLLEKPRSIARAVDFIK